MTRYSYHPLRNVFVMPALCIAMMTPLILSQPSPVQALSQPPGVTIADSEFEGRRTISLQNQQVVLEVELQDGRLAGDRLTSVTSSTPNGNAPRDDARIVATNAGFALKIMWTGWRAPGKVHNADNPVLLTARNFEFQGKVDQVGPWLQLPESTDQAAAASGGQAEATTKSRGYMGRRMVLFFRGTDNPLELRVTYEMGIDFWVRKRIAVRDTTGHDHFLQWIWPVHASLGGDWAILKPGGFGRPVAIVTEGSGSGPRGPDRAGNEAGAFFGLEYPAGTNLLGWTVVDTAAPAQLASSAIDRSLTLTCGQEMGQRIGAEWVESDWAVMALTPDLLVKRWFMKYLDSVRVAPLQPYLLYNSWYDVRAPEYTDRPEDVMNEANVLRIIGDFARVQQRYTDFRLDAFVLDDGWDVYKSDWVLRPEEFPRGLQPIVTTLDSMDCDLGIWFGPIGGYSHRDWRVGWMTEHGYEAEDDQMCVAGPRYHALLKKRTVDFVRDQGVGYFKWDGVQFSCSEPDHGHPVGIYSRRAVMEAVADLCAAVRSENPDIFLNITSGTWLSPWWLRFANMIWMQGYDYGYADVPSISRRDGAITYRDFVLYEDYGKNDFWFPLANLMTHGIIKGHLQKLGGEAEPLDKFTDNAVLYFARGVSMWELYVSPNLLSDAEWEVLARSIAWAKRNFSVLRSTEMIGGDPGLGQTYGYAHFVGNRGVVAARNPAITDSQLALELSPAAGLDPAATGLVIERTYPTRWIAPRLYTAGETVSLELQGFETAIYEIYPVEQATEPLLAVAVFTVAPGSYVTDPPSRSDPAEPDPELYRLKILETGGRLQLLNPGRVPSPPSLDLPPIAPAVLASNVTMTPGKDRLDISLEVAATARSAMLAVLFEPQQKLAKEKAPGFTVLLDGQQITPGIEEQKGSWSWLTMPIAAGSHTARLDVLTPPSGPAWQGRASVWLIATEEPAGVELELAFVPPPPPSLPSSPTQASRQGNLGTDQQGNQQGDRRVDVGGPAAGLEPARVFPPSPRPAGQLRHNLLLGEVILGLASKDSRKGGQR